jgi:hypothetical protein
MVCVKPSNIYSVIKNNKMFTGFYVCLFGMPLCTQYQINYFFLQPNAKFCVLSGAYLTDNHVLV